MAAKVARRGTSPETLEQKLLQYGVDVSAPDFQSELNEHMQGAMDAIPRPKNEHQEDVPEWFKGAAKGLHAFGRVGTMAQVLLISGGIGPIINVLLIVADTARIQAAIHYFEHNAIIQFLLAVITIFTYTFLAFRKSELGYLLRDDLAERFSLRRMFENIGYFLGTSKDWKPRTLKRQEVERQSVTRFFNLFRLGILTLLIMASLVTVANDYTTNPGKIGETLTGAAGSIIITMLLLVALDIQVERSYTAYMQTDGAQNYSLDFFLAELAAWQHKRQDAALSARWAFLALKLREAELANEPKALPKPQPEMEAITAMPAVFSTNGHHKVVATE